MLFNRFRGNRRSSKGLITAALDLHRICHAGSTCSLGWDFGDRG